MNNLQQRVILFIIVIPVLIGIILFLDFANNLLLLSLIMLFSIGLSYESARVLGLFPNPTGSTKSQKVFRNLAVPVIGASGPVLVFLFSRGIITLKEIGLIIVCIITLVLIIQVLRTQKNPVEGLLHQTKSYIFLALYPGASMGFLAALTIMPNSRFVFLMFLFSVFINDTAAYVAGRIFGKNSPKPFKVSPHKTLIGFIVGFFFSIIAMVLFGIFIPELFKTGLHWAFIIGFLVGITTIIGDLFESGLKRASGLKDSGSVIPGRGGLLDSLDSTLFSAPLFFFVYGISQQFI